MVENFPSSVAASRATFPTRGKARTPHPSCLAFPFSAIPLFTPAKIEQMFFSDDSIPPHFVPFKMVLFNFLNFFVLF
jgi:hypothetical protein